MANNYRSTGSSYADEGTAAHEWGEKILKGEAKESDVPEQYKAVLVYTDCCKTLIRRHGGTEMVERKVPLFYLPQQTGTVDFALVARHALFIVDYKHGAGKPVDAEWNKQLAIYAKSLIDAMEDNLEFSFDAEHRVEIRIIQPRYVGGEPEKIWVTTVGELTEFTADVEDKADMILAALNGSTEAQEQLVFAPGDACTWCPAKSGDRCPARRGAVNTALSVSEDVLAAFDQIDVIPEMVLPVPAKLTDTQLLTIFTHAKLIKSVVDDVVQLMLERAASGEPVTGTKLVAGRLGNRAWSDEEEVTATLKTAFRTDEFTERKLKSPAQVDKMLNDSQSHTAVKDLLKGLTSRSPGKPSLALASDKRPALANAADAFDLIEVYEKPED